MAKAFNSVTVDALRASLKCIKMDDSIINLLTDTFNERNILIITAYRNSKYFKPRVGIDQGDIVSPLLWRIFYDPLLCIVNKRLGLGYKLKIKTNIDVTTNMHKSEDITIGALAYA